MNVEDHFSRGCNWHERGEFEKAIAEFDDAIRLHSKARQEDIEDELLDCDPEHRETVRGYIDSVGLYTDYREVQCCIHRGYSWLCLCKNDLAIADYVLAITLDPKEPEPHLYLGDALCIVGEYEQAIREFSFAIAFDCHLKNAYKGRAFANRRVGKYRAAIADYLQAIRLG